MLIRKIRQKQIVNKKTLLYIILICVGVILIFKGLTSLTQNVPSPKDGLTPTWSQVRFIGKLKTDNNFPHYTHTLTTDKGEVIGLKSSTINLNDYLKRKIGIAGPIQKYFKTTPVIDVQSLLLPEQQLLITDNKYFFLKDFMYLDLSSQPQLSAIRSGNEINILYDNKNMVASIERFVCSKILKNQDCGYLVLDYLNSKKDTFDSTRGYTFYKHGTGFRTAFDGNTYGYLFKNVEDDMILDISTMFRMVNKDFITNNKMAQIQSGCRNADHELKAIYTANLSYADPYTIVMAIKGLDQKKKPLSCTVSLDVWNNWAPKLTKIAFE